MPEKRHQVVIVGAGFGGLWAARSLRDSPVDVLLLDRNNYHTFFPLLYQVAAAELEPEKHREPGTKHPQKFQERPFQHDRGEGPRPNRQSSGDIGRVCFPMTISFWRPGARPITLASRAPPSTASPCAPWKRGLPCATTYWVVSSGLYMSLTLTDAVAC